MTTQVSDLLRSKVFANETIRTTPVASQGLGEESKDLDISSWMKGDVIFVGTYTSYKVGFPQPEGDVRIPLLISGIHCKPTQVLRGGLINGKNIVVSNPKFGPPKFKPGTTVLVSANIDVETRPLGYPLQGIQIAVADEETIRRVKEACSAPMGWTRIDDKWHSPWANIEGAQWPDGDSGDHLRCAKTGRPAFRVGGGVRMEADRTFATEAHLKHVNGDLCFKVTLTNTSEKPTEVSALRRIGDKVLWNECLVIGYEGHVYPLPGAKGITMETKPVTLGAGENISHVLNLAAINEAKWPDNYKHVDVQLMIGDRRSTQTQCRFYNPTPAWVTGQASSDRP